MIKNSIEERRNFDRARRILSIRHRLCKRGGRVAQEPWYLSLTQDMSANGVLFNSAAGYRIDDILEIEVTLSGMLDIFKGYGKVVRVEKNGAGAGFLIALALIDLKEKKSRGKTKPRVQRKSRA